MVKSADEDRGQQRRISSFDDELKGPSAIAFVHGDPVAVAKSLRDFAKATPSSWSRAAISMASPLTAEEVGKLADLESREVLLAKLAGAFKGLAVRSRISVQRTAVEGRPHGRRAA